MTTEIITTKTKHKIIIKKCHVCGKIIESPKEVKKCPTCNKSFLPTNYFSKIHAPNSIEYYKLFEGANELVEEDLIKGLSILW